jgi:hypothetical protein
LGLSHGELRLFVAVLIEVLTETLPETPARGVA